MEPFIKKFDSILLFSEVKTLLLTPIFHINKSMDDISYEICVNKGICSIFEKMVDVELDI